MTDASVSLVIKRIFFDLFKRERKQESSWFELMDKEVEESKQEALDKIKKNPELKLIQGSYCFYDAVRPRKKKPKLKRFHSIRWFLGLLFRLSMLHWLSSKFRHTVILHGCYRPYGWCSILHDWFEKYIYKTPVDKYPVRKFFWKLLFELNYRGCPWCCSERWTYDDEDDCFDVIEDGSNQSMEERTYWWSGWKTCPSCGYYEYIDHEEL